MMTPVRALVGCGVLVAVVAALGFAVGGSSTAAPADEAIVLGPGVVTVELGIDHSAFSTSSLRVREGTEVRFVVENGDPILHELIVGPPEVHRRHEAGTEATHPPRPGEMTIEPLSSAMTTYAFDEPGEIEFACHLPGHLAYGMVGTVEVVPA
jgi:uncharacterized cupredoxin-like copper-binding protein